MKKVKLDLGKRSYPILIGAGLLKRAGRHIAALNIGNYAIVITNVRVKRLFADLIVKSLRKHGITSQIVTVADSERSKSSATYLKVIQSIARKDVRKRPFIVALGGGVIGDLAGFVAATYKRGIPFVQIPTTLLAQVDSAIGGKVGIDLESGKNLLGAFYQPRLVLSDVTALKTLPKGVLCSGLAEVIKYGVIRDAGLFKYIRANIKGILKGDEDSLEYIVARCSSIKAGVVERDEFDRTGVRAILNFGHTVGHAIEAADAYSERYSHGEAVAVGMVVASFIALRKRVLSGDAFSRIRDIVESAGLPTRIVGVNKSRMFAALLHDKKFVRGVPRLILPLSIGEARVVEGVSEELIREGLEAGVTGSYE